ncbi:MAG: bifunctional methionine sulfoxide reductase B/A protein [Planctomycetota bacterium]
MRNSVMTAAIAASIVSLAIFFGCRKDTEPMGRHDSVRRDRPAQPDSRPAAASPVRTATPTPPLTAEEKRVIEDKGTEAPFAGRYWNHFAAGAYVCRRCGAKLYESSSKFQSECGWPSFDDEVPGAVKRLRDADGARTEILCTACGAHLGHVFEGEGFTVKNVRHCVNSASLVFIPAEEKPAPAEAIFAGGCFWGVEHALQHADGVLSVTSGYTGGTVADPTYKEVSSGRTGHAEAVRIVFDPKKVSYRELAKLFFEIHDPTQVDGQGPDLGAQYRSAIFYHSDEEKQIAEDLIAQLRANGYNVVTELAPAGPFYTAEEYHQDYLTKHPGGQNCHARVPRFDRPAK